MTMLSGAVKNPNANPAGSIQDAMELLSEANKRLKRIAVEAGDAALDTAKDMSDKALTISKKAAQKVDESAHEHAWKYVGVASALSAMAGYYLGRCGNHE